MSTGFTAWDDAERQEVASITADIQVRVLNVSGAGCLIEARRALAIGSVATLQIRFAGGDFEDTVQIVRCQQLSGAGAVFHLGANFLTTTPPSIESLRYVLRRESGRSVGYIRLMRKD